MLIREWLDNIADTEGNDADYRLRVILKAGNELEITWTPSIDSFGTDDELTNGNYMIDSRSIAAIQSVE